MNIDEQAANQLIEYINNSAQFVADQAPAVVQEILRWSLVARSIGLGIGLAIMVGAVICWYKFRDKMSDYEMMPFLLGVFGTFGAGVFVANAYNLLQLTITPKVFLLRYLRHLF